MSLGSASDPEAIRAAPRALVYLTVDWSVPERESRRAFLEAAARLSREHAALGISLCSLDEEAAPTRALLSWLREAKGSGGGKGVRSQNKGS